jgi:hypothetical protein
MTSVLKVINPAFTSVETELEPISVSWGGDLNEPMTMTFTVANDYEDYADDTSATNPLQLRSSVTYTRGGTVYFDGYVINVTPTEDASATYPKQLRVECVDKLGAIKRCIAALSGDALATLSTTTTTRTEQTMLPLVVNSTTYYPDPSDTALWLSVSGTPKTVNTSTSGLTAGATSITTLSSASLRMRTKGLLVLGVAAEYVAYDGYDSNGSVYIFSNLTRGVLGSSDITHSTVVIYQWVPKRIDPTATITVEGQVSPTWIVIDPSLYTIDYENGSLEFDTDPSSAYPDGIRMTYDTYDEDDADAIILGGDTSYGLIDLLLQQSKDSGGPGLTTGQINIDIPRVVLPSTTLIGQNILDTISQLLEERYASGVTYDALEPELRPAAYWWSSPDNEFVLDQFNPSEAVADTIDDAAVVGSDRAMTDAHSGVLVKWTTDLVANSAFVQVSSTLGTSNFVRNTTVHAKMRNTGFPDVQVIDCGECSEGTARATAKDFLKRSWTLAYAHNYRLDALPDSLPQLGKRYTMPDGISGRCISIGYTMEAGAESMTMRIVDLDQEIA